MKAQAPPPPTTPPKSVASIRYGGVEHNTPYRRPQRLVQGVVRDESGKILVHAAVHVRDERTKVLRVITTDDAGKYEIGGLSLDHDLTVWAVHGEQKTAEKQVSSFVAMPDITMDFKFGAPVAVAPATTPMSTPTTASK